MAARAPAATVTTADLRAALQRRYARPEWAYFEEVANATGWQGHRYTDGVALNLYPSRGLTLLGFEIKSSRADWRRELKAPHKAEQGIVRYCDHWYVVAPPEVVPAQELPPTWGLLEWRSNGRLQEKVKAPKLEAQTLDRGFVAALLRRANEIDQEKSEAQVRAQVRAAVNAERERLQSEFDLRLARSRDRARDLEGRLQVVREQTGIDLLGYEPEAHAVALLKALQRTDVVRNHRGINELVHRLGEIQSQLQHAIADVPMLADILAEQQRARES